MTPDGYTCCCGSTFCTRTPGCSHAQGTGGNGGTGGAAPTIADAAVMPLPNPWPIGDGGIPWSVAVDPSCPSFEVPAYVSVNVPGIGLHGLAEIVTAVGCCLSSGVCGGAVPVERTKVDPTFPVANFVGWGPPQKCIPYADIDLGPQAAPQSCHYPFDASAPLLDATTASARDGGDACVQKTVAVTPTRETGACFITVPSGADLAAPISVDLSSLGLPTLTLTRTVGPCSSTTTGWHLVSADTIEICGQACSAFGSLPFTFTLTCPTARDASTDVAKGD